MANSTFSFTSPLDYLLFVPHAMSTIEHSFNERKVIPWMTGHWQWSFFYCMVYLTLIYLGQKYMKDRDPYNLRRALCMWSAGLSAFSFYAIIRVIPHAHHMVYLGGWQHAVCDTRSYVGSNGAGIWAFLFPLSKLPELVDTSFIVLRKQKMVFLHWYHHITVFVYCWYSYAYPISTGIWFGIVNYSVHAIMYFYYAIKASGRQPPRWVAKSITTVQLSQMFAGIFLNYMAIKALVEGKTCEMNSFAIGISIFFYSSYAILFGNFYYWTYVHRRPKKTDPAKSTLNESSDIVPTTAKRSQPELSNGSVPNGITPMSLRNGKVLYANGVSNDVKHRTINGLKH